MKSSTRTIVYCALFAALTCAVAPLSIPLPGGVPITLQMVTVMLAGLILGAKLGFISQRIYVLLGLVGLPVFAGLTGGLGKLAGPSGGFIIGFLFLAWLSGLLYFRLGRNKKGAAKYAAIVFSVLVGCAAMYVFGLGWFMVSTGRTLAEAFALCMLPFIPGDLLKIVLVTALVPQIEKAAGLSGSVSR